MSIVTWSGHTPLRRNRIRYRARAYHQQPIRMVDWLAHALTFAIEHGWRPRHAVTSGYRPGQDPHTASGISEHQGTDWNDGQTPCGAIDFGGFTDPVGKRARDEFIACLKKHGYRGHIPVAAPFHDDGHCSCNGH